MKTIFMLLIVASTFFAASASAQVVIVTNNDVRGFLQKSHDITVGPNGRIAEADQEMCEKIAIANPCLCEFKAMKGCRACDSLACQSEGLARSQECN